MDRVRISLPNLAGYVYQTVRNNAYNVSWYPYRSAQPNIVVVYTEAHNCFSKSIFTGSNVADKRHFTTVVQRQKYCSDYKTLIYEWTATREPYALKEVTLDNEEVYYCLQGIILDKDKKVLIATYSDGRNISWFINTTILSPLLKWVYRYLAPRLLECGTTVVYTPNVPRIDFSPCLPVYNKLDFSEYIAYRRNETNGNFIEELFDED